METTMTEYTFETERPVHLFTEIGRGSLRIVATDTTQTHVQISGRDADQVRVDQHGRQVNVVAPKQRGAFFGGDGRVDVAITVPTESQVVARTGSADITVVGTIEGGQLKSGSGNVELETANGPVGIDTGSGDIRVDAAHGGIRVKSGSGDVLILELGKNATVSTGSGDIEIGTNRAQTVVKTGSGDLKVGRTDSDLAMTTGSGDLAIGTASRGRLSAKGASGDIQIGIPSGVPVWTDISTVTGAIRSDLTGSGKPEEGADHVELRARTVSGDVILTQL
jgi:DUF4097 and DUF4098 domain-containing protein YvlB